MQNRARRKSLDELEMASELSMKREPQAEPQKKILRGWKPTRKRQNHAKLSQEIGALSVEPPALFVQLITRGVEAPSFRAVRVSYLKVHRDLIGSK